jgi:glycosyltransferase involved in cell wall biosynthesis
MEKFTVAYVGRPVWQKGWDLFQRIAARAEDELNVDFVSVGPTKSAPNIHSLGYVSDRKSLAEVYSKVHLVVLPSRADAFCLASVESLSCGTPVLTTPLKTHFEMTLPLLYGTNDVDFLDTISKISSMWNDEREEYGSLQSKCVEAAGNYNLEIVMPQWVDMLRKIASNESQKEPPTPNVCV